MRMEIQNCYHIMLPFIALSMLTTTVLCEYNFKRGHKDTFKGSHVLTAIANQNESERMTEETLVNESLYRCKDLIGRNFSCVNIDPRCAKEDWGPAVFTYERMCGKCLGNAVGWTLYLFLATFPTTVFFLIVVGCGIRATSAPMNAFVCIVQVALCLVSINLDYYKEYAPQIYSIADNIAWVVATIFSIWNLDFFRFVIPPFCITKNLSVLHVLAMEYIVAIYPLVFIVLTYTCIELHDKEFKPLVLVAKPFKRCFSCLRNWNPKMTIIEAFATFFILSYSKLLFTSFNFIVFTTKYTVNVTNDRLPQGHYLQWHGIRVMLYDPSIKYLNTKHVPFFILATMFLMFFNVLPFFILLLYPTKIFQKALGYCTRIQWHPLHAFIDAIQGCYKNGTNGTPDCRYFSALYLLVRMLYRVPEFVTFSDSVVYSSIFVLISHTFCMLIGVIRPYKNDFYNKLDLIVFFLLPLGQLWYSVFLNTVGTVTEAILILIVTVCFIVGTVYKTLSLCAPRLLNNCKRKCRHCYKYLINKQNTNPDEGLESDDEIVRVHDDEDDYPERSMNSGVREYQELLASAQTSEQQRNPITGCHYTYGSLQ